MSHTAPFSSSAILNRFQARVAIALAWITLVQFDSTALLRAETKIVLTDVTADSGINFVHDDGHYGAYYLIEAMSAGIALFDYDADGDLDIYFPNGAVIGKEPGENPPRNALYRNDGDFKFTDVTDAAGVGDTKMGLGVGCADYDNDGWTDLYVNNYGRNVLYHNNGDGSFTDCSDSALATTEEFVGGGVSFFDMDLDGDLDLYSANYVKFDPANHKTHVHKGLPSYPSPLSMEPQSDTLYRNNGDGTFSDFSEESGILEVAGRSMGLITFDYDQDGDIDVYVANDTQDNFLFENDGTGHFEEVALLAGLAYDYRGKPQASMGVDVFDFDHDGHLDLYLTSFSEEFATLYRNTGVALFDDITLKAGASVASFPHVKWGVVAADFDNDTYDDILIACGDLDDLREKRGGMGASTAFKVPNVLLKGTESGALQDMGKDWGSGALVTESTRGLVAADLNNDGLLDVVALNARAQPTILRNDSLAGKSLVISLEGKKTNRDGLGTNIVVTLPDGSKRVQQTHSGCSYQCDNRGDIHFGVGSSTRVEIEVSWPSGASNSIAGEQAVVHVREQ